MLQLKHRAFSSNGSALLFPCRVHFALVRIHVCIYIIELMRYFWNGAVIISEEKYIFKLVISRSIDKVSAKWNCIRRSLLETNVVRKNILLGSRCLTFYNKHLSLLLFWKLSEEMKELLTRNKLWSRLRCINGTLMFQLIETENLMTKLSANYKNPIFCKPEIYVLDECLANFTSSIINYVLMSRNWLNRLECSHGSP